ncbi:MAG TPA: DUF433 domain-containing protein [Thermomicrobiaceae bacterium]|nr:DUF433 domain-containing protein [Thermomicrobiaceae bacterium]
MATTDDPYDDACAGAVATGTIEVLIARHIDADPYGLGPATACLREHRISVTTVVARLREYGGELEDVADDFQVPAECVLAALYFSWRYRSLIDARVSPRQRVFCA